MTDAETVARIATQFTGPDPAESIRPFGGGHINETFLIETAAGDYVVQCINRSVFADPERLMENIAVVWEHLRGRFVPRLAPARDGGWLVFHGDDAWRAWIRVPGAGSVDEPTQERVGAAANLLGRLHGALADLDPGELAETLPDFHDPARRLAALREIVTIDPCGRAEGVRAEIAAAVAAAPLAGRAEGLAARVPRRVAHNDAKLDNFLFRDADAVCIVDLDTVMPTAWFWDVGDLLRTASTHAAEDEPDYTRAVVDPALYRAILSGYRAGLSTTASGPTDNESAALDVAGAIVTYEQALRFLTDWIAGDVYYRTTRTGQNLDRARAQLNLLSSMPGTVAAS